MKKFWRLELRSDGASSVEFYVARTAIGAIAKGFFPTYRRHRRFTRRPVVQVIVSRS